jgi:hypothetical protein
VRWWNACSVRGIESWFFSSAGVGREVYVYVCVFLYVLNSGSMVHRVSACVCVV